MPYFFSDENLIPGKVATLAGDEARHLLLSRRVKIGEQVKVQGPNEKRFLAEVTRVRKKDLDVKIMEQISVPEEPKTKITLFQAIVAEAPLDLILQKATELGAYEVILFNSQYTATKLNKQRYSQKQDRWANIMRQAAKQCERVRPPVLSFVNDVDGIRDRAKDLDCFFIFDISGQALEPKTFNLKPNSIGIVVGPEGGLSQGEIKTLSFPKKSKLINLGPRILKAETAAVASIAILQNL